MSKLSRFIRQILKPVARRRSYRNCDFPGRHDLDARWQLLSPYLPEPGGWFLDIGSNNGDTLRRLAASGHYALGLEADPEAIAPALPAHAAIMVAEVRPDSLASLPRFDGIFLLSVFHRIWALQGPEAARAILAAVAPKTGLLFFEGCSRHARYRGRDGLVAPDFTDLDLDESRRWHTQMFASLVPRAEIHYLGVTHTKRTKDPRPLFCVRIPASSS